MARQTPLSIYTNFYHGLPDEEQLSKIWEAGFTDCELSAPIPFEDKDRRTLPRQIRQLQGIADRLGLSLSQAHGYWGGYAKPGSQEWKALVAFFKQEIEVAAQLGVKVIVSHPMYRNHILKANPVLCPTARTKLVFDHNVELFSALIP